MHEEGLGSKKMILHVSSQVVASGETPFGMWNFSREGHFLLELAI